MSTNIGNGRIIRAPIKRAYDLLINAKPEAEKIGRDAQIGWMAHHAADLIDKSDMTGEILPNAPLVEAWTALLDAEKEIKINGLRNPDCDFEFELWLFPVSNNRTMLIVQTERREFSQWLDGLGFVDNYAYWDSTDPDEAVSPQAWRRRQQDWERVLPHGSAISDRCLTMVMFNHQRPMPPSPKEAVSHITERRKRAERHAWPKHIGEIYERMLAERRELEPAYEPSGFSLYFEAEALARKDLNRRDQIVHKIHNQLRDISVDDLSHRS